MGERERKGQWKSIRQWDESEVESVDSFSDLYPGETLGRLWRGWMSDYRWR